MKDYVTRVSRDFVEKMCDLAVDDGIDYEVFEGCLLDNYVFYNSGGLTVKGVKPRNHIIIREVYLNEWSSGFELIMTDSSKKVDKYTKIFES